MNQEAKTWRHGGCGGEITAEGVCAKCQTVVNNPVAGAKPRMEGGEPTNANYWVGRPCGHDALVNRVDRVGRSLHIVISDECTLCLREA